MSVVLLTITSLVYNACSGSLQHNMVPAIVQPCPGLHLEVSTASASGGLIQQYALQPPHLRSPFKHLPVAACNAGVMACRTQLLTSWMQA
jgi:hypothetical protein